MLSKNKFVYNFKTLLSRLGSVWGSIIFVCLIAFSCQKMKNEKFESFQVFGVNFPFIATGTGYNNWDTSYFPSDHSGAGILHMFNYHNSEDKNTILIKAQFVYSAGKIPNENDLKYWLELENNGFNFDRDTVKSSILTNNDSITGYIILATNNNKSRIKMRLYSNNGIYQYSHISKTTTPAEMMELYFFIKKKWYPRLTPSFISKKKR